ncbi:hypothetical protein AMAG_04887 [Allomyces macrogynus ATCC 38327]|uniref:t-SNARE coiled-coil homology domain-containing protein n=1 Tax=Allomyces macrogynus (strain ATCC 38327) TaxID=578462 RepID=A0A0L0S662_ALLM3|nr:hypothetical protein AMAG_04887 [Allomyces macrogynus ATCC 38327]|eukprot:KNE58063.1 hypothetical protein AMAG_04887 [Allomyces macrogynus ATCC 38327]
MAEELAEYDEQLKEITETMENVLQNEVSKLTGPARLEKCEYLKNRLNRGRQLVKSINVEMRELPTDKRAPWVEKVKVYENKLAKLQQDINWAITSAERGNGTGPAAKEINDMTAKDMTATALAIQGQSMQSTTRAKAAIAATIQLGTETVDVLKQQTEQIDGIDKKVDQVESNLKRADKQLRAFLRKMATDRIIMIFIFLIVLGIIGAILVSIFDPKGKLGASLQSQMSKLGVLNITVTRSAGGPPLARAAQVQGIDLTQLPE